MNRYEIPGAILTLLAFVGYWGLFVPPMVRPVAVAVRRQVRRLR